MSTKSLKTAMRFARAIERSDGPCVVRLMQSPPNKTIIRIGNSQVWIEVEFNSFICETESERYFLFSEFKKLVNSLSAKQRYKTEIKPEGMLFVGSERIEYLSSCAAFEFPNFAEENKIEIPCPLLIKALKSVQFAISHDQTRTALTGVYLHAEEDNPVKLKFVATDGHRLVENSIGITNNMPINIILRKEVVDFISGLRSTDTENAELKFSDHGIELKIDSLKIYTRGLDTSFPAYERIFPTEFKGSASVYRNDFVPAMQEYINRHKSKIAPGITLDFKETVALAGTIRYCGYEENIEMTLPVQSSTEEIVGVNPEYLLDLLNATEAKKIIVHFPNDRPPGSYTSEPLLVTFADEPALRALLMPLHPYTYSSMA